MLSLSACRKSLNNKFLHAVRLREMELNFVFLRVVTVHWYCSRAKNEKRLKKLGLNVQAFFNPSVRNKLHPPPFTQGRLNKVYLIIFWRGSDHFIDSLKATERLFLLLSACRKSLNNKFLHADRLREMELNFVFLRVVTVQYQVATKQSTGLFFPNSMLLTVAEFGAACHRFEPPIIHK